MKKLNNINLLLTLGHIPISCPVLASSKEKLGAS
jgi:hypothetical protein